MKVWTQCCFKRLPLRFKLILPTWLMSTSILLAVGGGVYFLAKNYLEQHLTTRAQILVDNAASNLKSAVMFNNNDEVVTKLTQLKYDPELIAVFVFDNEFFEYTPWLRLPKDCSVRDSRLYCRSTTYIMVSKNITRAKKDLGHVELYISRTKINQKLQTILITLLAICLILSVLSLFFARLIQCLVTEPLVSLHRSMTNIITTGLTDTPLVVRHKDELGQLTQCFNDMVATLSARDKALNQAFLQLESKTYYINKLLETMSHGVMVIAPGSKIIYCNPCAEQILKEADCDPYNLEQIKQQFEPRAMMEKLSQAISNKEPIFNIKIFHRESDRYFRVSSVPIASEQHLLVQFADVTAEYLEEKRRKLAELIFDQQSHPCLVLARNFVITTQNTAFIDCFGEVEHIQQLEIDPALPFNKSAVRQLLRLGKFYWQAKVLSKQKGWLPCKIRLQPVLTQQRKIQAFVITLIDQTAEIEFKRLNHMAYHDSLTGLANRAHAFNCLNQAHHLGQHLYILFIDLDGFKAVNDNFGHNIGDELLKIVAKRLAANVSKQDLVARLAGDEFIVGLNNPQNIKHAVERLLTKLQEPIFINDLQPKIGASIGVRRWSASDSASLEKVLMDADQAMYEVKAQGKNNYFIIE